MILALNEQMILALVEIILGMVDALEKDHLLLFVSVFELPGGIESIVIPCGVANFS